MGCEFTKSNSGCLVLLTTGNSYQNAVNLQTECLYAVDLFCNLACFLSDVSFSARFPKLGFMSCEKANT